MKILHVIHDFLPRHRAGAEIYCERLASAQAREHEVTVLCTDFDPLAPHGALRRRRLGSLAVSEVNNLTALHGLTEDHDTAAMAAVVRREIARVAPDVVHVHSLLNLPLELPTMAREQGCPVVATLHDYSLFCPAGGTLLAAHDGKPCDRLDPARCARCVPRSDLGTLGALGRLTGQQPTWMPLAVHAAHGLRRVWPASFVALEQTVQALGRTPITPAQVEARLRTVRQAVAAFSLLAAPSRALARTLVRLGLSSEHLVISDYGFPAMGPLPPRSTSGPLRLGFVGTVARHKGPHLLLEALSALPPASVELLVFGSLDTFPAYSAALRQQARGLPVHFRGSFAPKAAASVYGELDLLVVPSLWPENSPLVIHEAHQAGVPVLCSDLGGGAELVEHRRGGLTFQTGSAQALTARIEEILARPETLTELRQSIPPVKSIEADASFWLAHYQRLQRLDQRGLAPTENRGLEPTEAAGSTEPADEPRPPHKQAIFVKNNSTVKANKHGNYSVTVLLLTRDGAETLPDLLQALDIQDFREPVQRLALDSGSTDRTLELLDDAGFEIHPLAPALFGHGRTRNHGLALCRGEFVVLLSQDAVPLGPRWLRSLLAPLRTDPRLAGTFARQTPRPDADALTRLYAERWPTHDNEPRVVFLRGPEELERLAPMQRLRVCLFDNVCSCIRRSVWKRRPFPDLPFAEDLGWSRQVLLDGDGLAFVPDAVVVHSHDRPALYELRRTYQAHRQLRRLFGLRTIPTPAHLSMAIAGTLGSHLLCLARSRPTPRGRPWRRALALSVVLPLGQYLGAAAADLGIGLLPDGGV